jgi:hypothetical protein
MQFPSKTLQTRFGDACEVFQRRDECGLNSPSGVPAKIVDEEKKSEVQAEGLR